MRPDGDRPVEAVVCIPTFRRPEGLALTLRSLLEQKGDVDFAILVVENDAGGLAGARCAAATLAGSDRPWAVCIEPQQGNCHAINRAFAEARCRFPSADYFLMIDDDEIASADWLAHMVGTARRTGAGIVGGPVVRRFEVAVSEAISQHELNSHIGGHTRQVPVIHGSGNCLILREVFSGLDSAQFDTAFNFLGGGDMDFFARCRSAGFVFWWCEEAVIHETVARDRASAAWLMRRSIRTGGINYVIDRKRATSGLGVVLLQGKNVISLGLGVMRSLTKLSKTGSPLIASHPILMSIGRLAASLGFLPAPYKASAIPAAEPMPSRDHNGQLINN